MKHTLKMTALAVFAATLSAGAVAADKASTTGGFKIKSEDGNFEAKLGGRIHFDANYYVDEDDINTGAQNTKNDFFFRRARLTLEGRAYDFTYKFENDFANSAGGGNATQNEGLREMWIGKKVLNGANLRLGQAKPYRGMEEITSSNEILFMERPMTTATGIYSRQFVQGVFLDGHGDNYGWGVSLYNPRSAADTNRSGSGVNGRAYFVPVRSEGNIVHVGVSASQDKYDTTTATVRPRIVGREGGLRISGTAGNQIIDGGVYEDQTSAALELAGRFGPLMMQGEYTLAKFEDAASVAQKVDVAAYTIQASYMLTDHTRPYDFKKGVFKSPKVNGEEGAVELKARFDKIENKDQSNREGSYYGVGVNYYATPNTRFMLEYIDGQLNNNSATELEASAITARAQFNF